MPDCSLSVMLGPGQAPLPRSHSSSPYLKPWSNQNFPRDGNGAHRFLPPPPLLPPPPPPRPPPLRFSDIEALPEPLKKDPRASDESFLSAVVTSYAAAGMLEHALRTLDEIPFLGAPCTALSLSALLSALNHSPLPSSRRRVPELFADLSRRLFIAPDKVSYGILVKSHCLTGNARKALAVLKEMEEKKIEVTTVTYTTLLDSFYKEGRPENAERLWKEMEKKGCKPDLPAYNVRVMYRALEGKPQDVLDLIREIEAAALKLDTITYNYLISCYCSHGRFKEAKKVYKE